MRSLNLRLYLQLNSRHGILKFRSAVCWLNLKIQRALCHLRAIKMKGVWLNLKPLRASDKFRCICQPAVSVKFKIPQTRISAFLNGTAIRCVKFAILRVQRLILKWRPRGEILKFHHA